MHREIEQLRQWIDRTPFRLGETPLRVVPNLEQTAVHYYTRGHYDDYWSQEANDFTAQFHRHADIPGTYSSRRWFDRWLKGEATGVETEPPVRLLVGGETAVNPLPPQLPSRPRSPGANSGGDSDRLF